VTVADQRQANAVSERPTTTTGVVGGDGSRDSASPSSVTTSPLRRRSSPAPPTSSDQHAGIHRPQSTADVELLPLRHNGIARDTCGHVISPDTESSKLQDEASVMRYDQRQECQQQQLGSSAFHRAGQYITTPHPPSSSSTTIQRQTQQQTAGYPLSYGYDMVDTRWMFHGQHPRTTFGPARDHTASGYIGGGGGLVGNATPTLARRATVEYRAQPSTTTSSGVYSMDYPSAPLNFAALPFQATAGYGKHNY